MNLRLRLLAILAAAMAAAGAAAQEMPPGHTGQLAVEIDALAFFKDNEFEGQQAKGYSLPGFWLQPRLAYQPLDAVAIEAGFHALVFDGAGKYPCYAYHDIGRWKGSQYQSGTHVLPFFRARARMGNLTVVLGDIYGADAHGIISPLWNPELTMTQDPEMGLQLLASLPHWNMDAWVNWQSYIFEEDTHQEAFTVGVHSLAETGRPGKALRLRLPAGILVQHRGGEQDATDMGVQTIANAYIGAGLQWAVRRSVLRSLGAEAAVMGCWQQSGQLWPFDTGAGAWAQATAELAHDIRLQAGIFHARNFVSLYGAPFYSTLSQKFPGARFSHLLTPHLRLEWHHTFADTYTLGALAELYPLHAGRLTFPTPDDAPPATPADIRPARFDNNFSFGIYFCCSPRFVLNKR